MNTYQNRTRDFDDCKHPTLIMELAFGGPTGNFICLECERLLTRTQIRFNQDSIRLKPEKLLTNVA